jgi:murein DD-endopeptidase MepM/ murein hydrolase activator NlpD
MTPPSTSPRPTRRRPSRVTLRVMSTCRTDHPAAVVAAPRRRPPSRPAPRLVGAVAGALVALAVVAFGATASGPPAPWPGPASIGHIRRVADVVPAPPDPAPGALYAWPLRPGVVRGVFRPPAHPYGPGHRGVDLGGVPGQPVYAARAGSVVFAGPVGGRGVVSVQHDDGLRTTYAPVRPAVTAGSAVDGGQVIGLLDPGLAGCPDPACLHWGVRRGPVEYVDPLVLLRPPRVRLLPVPDPWPDR